jgi:hypothetical protein
MNLTLLFTGSYWKQQFWPSRKRFLAYWLGTYGAVWGILEPIAYFFPDFRPTPNPWLWIIFAIGLLHGFYSVRPRWAVEARIAGSDIFAEVRVTDVFQSNSPLIVPCNTTFDIDIGRDFLVPSSIQGQLVAKEFGGNASELDEVVSNELVLLDHRRIETLDQGTKPGRLDRFQLGTIVRIKGPATGRTYYLLAMSHIGESGRAHCSLSDIRAALEDLWTELPKRGTRSDLMMPLLGTNMGRLSGTRKEIVSEILLTFVEKIRQGEPGCVNRLTVAIRNEDAEKYNLSIVELGRILRHLCR